MGRDKLALLRAENLLRQPVRPEKLTKVVKAFMRPVDFGQPLRILHQIGKHRILVEDSSVPPALAVKPHALLRRPKEPMKELLSLFLRLDLLIILYVIEKQQPRALSSPLSAANLLSRTAPKDTKLVSILALNDKVRFRVCNEAFYVKFSDNVVIFVQLERKLTDTLRRHLLR